MESLRHRPQSRAGKGSKKWRSETRIMDSLASNGIVDDINAAGPCHPGTNRTEIFDNTSSSKFYIDPASDLTLTKQSESGKSSGVDITSCKPCSVILDRLSEEDVEKLLLRSNLREKNLETKKNKKKKNRKKQPSAAINFRQSVRTASGKYMSYNETKAALNLPTTCDKRFENLPAGSKPNQVDSNDSTGETVNAKNESRASCSDEGIKPSRYLLHQEKFTPHKPNSNAACEPDPQQTTSRVEDYDANGGSLIGGENSEMKVQPSKRFRLSLKVNKTSNTKDNGTRRRDSRAKIKQTGNMEEVDEAGIDSEALKSSPPMVRQNKSILKKEMAGTENAEDPCSKSSQTQDITAIDRRGFDSETKASPQKHLKLSINKKRNDTKNDAVCRRDLSGEDLQPEESAEMIKSSVLDLNHLRRLIKRRLDGPVKDEASVSKVKKLEGQRSNKEDELDSLPRKSSAPRSSEKLKDPPVLGNRRSKQIQVQDPAPKVSNVRVSILELESKTNPGTSERVDNVEASDCGIDRHDSINDCQTQISGTETKDLGQSCSNKTRDTKITDYFFKIDKSSAVSKSRSLVIDQGARDLLAKKKYGISKDAIVSLIDIKKLRMLRSRYSASKIEKLTQEYYAANLSINIESTSTTKYVPSLSSVPSRNISPSFNELSSTDITHRLSVNDHVEKPSPDSIQTHRIPLAKNLSPEGLNSSQVKKPLVASPGSINYEQTSPDFANVPLVDDLTVQHSHDAVGIQRVPALDNVSSVIRKPPRSIQTVPMLQNPLTARRKSPRVKQQSPSKVTQVALNNDIVNTGTPGSKKEKLSSNNLNEDLDIIQEILDKELLHQNPAELRATVRSSPVNAKEHENRSSDSRIKNVTPKSSKTLNLQLRELAVSPQGRIVSFNDEIPSKESQVHATDVNNKSPKTVEMHKKSDASPCTSVSDVLPNNTELQKKPDDTSALGKDSNIVKKQPGTPAAPISVIKSPTNMGTPRFQSKQEGPRRLPPNSMTILSCEMIEKDNAWMGLDDTDDDLNKDRSAAAKNDAMAENASLTLCPSQNGTKERTRTSCNITTNADDICIRDSSSVENSFLRKALVPQSTENVSPKRPAGTSIEPSSSAVTGSGIAEKRIDYTQHRDSVTELETSVVNDPCLIPTPGIDNEIDPISVEGIDQDCEDSNAQKELPADSQQEGQLLIDTDESDSESQPAEDILPGTSSSSCLNSSLEGVVQDEKAPAFPGKVCIICKRTFKTITGLETHLRTHIAVTHTVSRCHICDKRVTKKNKIEHYLQHCGCLEDGQFGTHACGICKLKFRKRSSLSGHMKSEHNAGKTRIRSKVDPTSEDYNKCTICQATYESKEDLFSHVLKHTSQELQDAFAVEKAKLDLRSGNTTVCEDQGGSIPGNEKTQDKQQSAELTETNNTLPTSPPPVANFDVSICMCHKDERLEMSGSVIIEIALTCMECKTFFKTKKCFEDHYNSTSCKWSDKTVVTPSMFCNKCCTILNNLQDMHGHLTKHGDINVDTKTSMFCKHCNILFYGVGSLFYAHWSEHRKNPLFLAEHYSFPKNTRVRIIELGGPELAEEGQPTESLFIADHQCQNCLKPFHSDDELKKHVKSCTKKVDSESQAVENSKSVFKLVCSICNKEFVDKSTFDSHMEEHDSIKDLLEVPKILEKSLENNQLTCIICKTEYDTITSYKEHLKRHEVIQEKFLCNYCTLMMDSVEDFEQHSAEHKGTLEKPVSCKVVFAISKFHCKVCKIWLDNQSVLDEHLATHINSLTSSTKVIENSVAETVPVIEKQSYICATCQKEFDHQLKLDAHVATHNKGSLEQPIEDPLLIHLSDDSNSTDIEIIATKTKGESEEPVVGNTLLKEQQEIVNMQEPKKPAFLRVKNLKELLPYACSKCKAEFDTQINLSKHLCVQDVNQTQDKGFNYFCKICKNYPCDNDSDWNLHVLSHFPLKCSQEFSETWYHVRKMQCGQQIFKCKVCPNYDSLTIHTMRRHFISSHPDIYHPIFKCRVCNSFRTTMEMEIRRHEAAHFKQSPPQPAIDLAHNLLPTVSVENSSNCEQPSVLPSVISSSNNTSLLNKPVENLNNSHQPDLIPTFVNLVDDVPPRQSAENSNKFQQSVPNPSVIKSGNSSSSLQTLRKLTNSEQLGSMVQSQNISNDSQQGSNPSINVSGNNSPSIQPMQRLNNIQQPGQTRQPDSNSNNLQQSGSTPPVTNAGNNLSLQPVDNSNNFQQEVWVPSVVSSVNNSTLVQRLQSFNNSQESVRTSQPDSGLNNFQLSISIPSVTNAGSDLLPTQPVENSNKFQQSAEIAPVTSLGNNLPLKYFMNSQQPGATLQSENNPTNVQELISTPPITSASTSLASLQSMDNRQWSTTTAPTLQFQINGTSPFSNMANVVHTVPLYVANVIYCCRICKIYKCSSEQELKIHESLHDLIQLNETSNGLYQCKLCTNVFCSGEEQLRAHMDMYHGVDKSNVSKNRTQSNVVDTQYKCKQCLQTFSSSAQLIQHVHTAHTSMLHQQLNPTQFQHTYPYPCQICSIGFLNEAFLQAHMRQIHPNVKLPRQKTNDSKTLYQCDTCGLLLISEATLSYHMRSHNMRYQ